MKKRDLKGFTKEAYNFTRDALDPKKKRALNKDVGKIKIPYKMLAGMKNKSVERMKNREKSDKVANIVGDSGRNTKLM